VNFYTFATEWANVMGMVEELIKHQEDMTNNEQEKLKNLLQELETVKSLAEKYQLTWYRH
jgi:phosphopantothenate synthetase